MKEIEKLLGLDPRLIVPPAPRNVDYWMKKTMNLRPRNLGGPFDAHDATRLYGASYGLYCFYPFDALDKDGKGIWKIGLATNISKRLQQYHTYFPAGVYGKCFLSKPDLFRKVGEADTLKKYLLTIEKFIFERLKKGGSIQIKKYDDSRQFSEWVYTNEKTIEKAFEEAQDEFGGKLYITDVKHSFKKVASKHFTGEISYSHHEKVTKKAIEEGKSRAVLPRKAKKV